jgi:hypothetical protein
MCPALASNLVQVARQRHALAFSDVKLSKKSE